MAMAVTRTPSRKAIRMKMTNSVVVKEAEQAGKTEELWEVSSEAEIFPRL